MNTQAWSTSAAARFALLALFWGSSFTLIKVSLTGLTPSQLVLARLVLGATVLLALARLRGLALPRGRSTWLHIAAAAALGNVVPFLLLSYGELSTSAGSAGVLIGATPLLTLAVATAALRQERATAASGAGVLLGFLGVVLVIAPWQEAAGSAGGQLACLGAALSYAVGFVHVRRHLSPRRLTPLALAAAQLTAAAGLQVLVTPFLAWDHPDLTVPVISSIAVLGLLGTGAAYVLYFRLISDLGATAASTVNYAVPVIAVLAGVVLLDEPLTWHLIVGGLTVLIGVAAAQGRLPHLHRWPGRARHLARPGNVSRRAALPAPAGRA